MDILLYNFQWMGLNVFLAFLGVLFGWLFLRSKKIIFQFIFFALWILFVPNTIYLVTDLQYFPEQFVRVGLVFKLMLVVQYLVLFLLGPVTFILGMYPIDKVFREIHLKKKSGLRVLILVMLNFVIALAIVLGKFERTNSWDVFTNFGKAETDFINLLSDQGLILLALGFGIFTNFLYFGWKRVFR